jgi:hypothetical protein
MAVLPGAKKWFELKGFYEPARLKAMISRQEGMATKRRRQAELISHKKAQKAQNRENQLTASSGFLLCLFVAVR